MAQSSVTSEIVDPESGIKDPRAEQSKVGDAFDKSADDDTRFTCVYFGYGSNLSARTMKQRCPDSLFTGLAVLKGWRWMINETGYANIIPGNEDDEVYGSLCFLSGRDESALDESEGVPWLYEKMQLKVRRVLPGQDGRWSQADDELEATGYVDFQRVSEGRIDKEYIVWIKKAVEDALLCGMPKSYSDKYLEPYIPADISVNMNTMMVRTTRFKDKGPNLIPRGFASWSRG